MNKQTKSVTTFINPSGFIEQHYIGAQNGKTVAKGVNAVNLAVKKLRSQHKAALVLVDISQVTTTNLNSHMAAVKGMREVPFKKIAIYGPLSLQILLNTLAIVADKHDLVHAFSSRIEAIEWLREGD